MSPAFAAEYVPLSSGLCPLTTQRRQHHSFVYEVPRAPRRRVRELPSESSVHTWDKYLHASTDAASTISPFHDSPPHPPFNPTYPINLISNLTCQQRITLWDIGLYLPIHVHTPTAHIGTICGDNDFNGCLHGTLNAVDVFELLRSLACAPLELQPTFDGLQPIMKNLVRDAFYARTSGPGQTLHLAHCDAIWSRFINGCLGIAGVGVSLGTGITSSAYMGPPASPPPPGGRPLGRDLLLGNCDVWGFERASCTGCDVVHLG